MKKYIKPSIELVNVEMTAMVAVSGHDSEYDPNKPIRTKEEVDWNDGSFWGE